MKNDWISTELILIKLVVGSVLIACVWTLILFSSLSFLSRTLVLTERYKVSNSLLQDNLTSKGTVSNV